MTDRIHPTMSSVAIADAAPGWFARVLRHEPTGTRYYAPTRERSTAKAAFVRTPAPQPAEPLKRPRWTEERIAALPLTSGALTRVDFVHQHRRHGTAVVLRCEGGATGCRGHIEVAAALFARDCRPMSCKPCAYKRKRAMSAVTDKGYANARAFAAAQKRRHDEPEAAE